ncbi:SDR family oxidoreductase [Labrys monachus]|uniref:Saccharopine dehydrogenase n=1 Tax=Labrys monachus TaxID=217067 RepID=A0ABU0FE40_9HYPH|nr:SDR family oxidoreductase [Labrys monachus]MDQ0392325.1 hypothetical protein [Labrys monachus]
MSLSPSSLRILILGGYGTFGGRLVRLLAGEERLTLIVAGRSAQKAAAFCAGIEARAQLQPAAFDRAGPAAAQMRALAPDIVVDASGPFQSYGEAPYRIVEAAIAQGASYLDLADGAGFVAGIEAFDADAGRAGVFALSGLSTCPAITAAAVRRLAEGLDRIDRISGGIAPSPRVRIGLSVLAAITSYAGKPIALLRNGRPATGYAIVETLRRTIAPPGALPLRDRLFALVDVPDLTLLPRLWPASTSVWFGAAPAPEILYRSLIAMAFLVRWRLLPSLLALAPLLHRANGVLRWGENRGGMFVSVEGRDAAGKRRDRSWHLIAEGDDGPFIPAMPAAAIILRTLDGRAPAQGARPALHELALEDLRPLLAARNIVTGIREDGVQAGLALYPAVLGAAYEALPAPIQALHRHESGTPMRGRADIDRGTGMLARLVAACFGFPAQAKDVPVAVRFEIADGTEIWHRDFAGRRFRSVQSAGTGRNRHLVEERFGPFVFGLALVATPGRLRLVVRNWRVFGIPLPRFLAPYGDSHESGADGRFNFHVEIAHPLLGLIVRYRGWLVPGNGA